ncbi:MAG: Pullulanase precursor [Bacteroidetes bacterium ADurb.Bin408]|nr:MAG: Pullulanase precursor [Bacteroidetes bacterium ADurb.Bin408]
MFEPDVAGTYKGFISKTDYLKSLGVTHVQLMPVQNFYTVNETDREYRSGTATASNYNWGYDPHNYFTPEGWFSTNARNPYVRVKEFREMIQNLHTRNIGVIMDVVYNHAYIAETFENIAPGCYHRFDENYALSGKTGAGPGLESRHVMVRKLIIESLKHFVKEYHVDGFRFDLMGFIDHETMVAIRDEVGKAYNPANPDELILQGEAWLFSDLSLDVKAAPANAATTKIYNPGLKLNAGIFNDASRDSYTGRGFEKGFVQGVFKEYDRVVSSITGGLKSYDAGQKVFNSEIFNDSYNRFAETPANCLNYLSIHDGFTLWDKLNLSVKDPSKVERARLMRLASAMLFTSQGKIILHGGDEILRTKPLSANDKERNRAHTTPFTDEEEGVMYFHENTYCSNDYTNMFRWDRLTNEYYEFSSHMLDYYKGLIQMRRQLPCLRYHKTENVIKGLEFLCSERPNGALPLYKGFNDEKLNALEINFINGPKYERYYLAGEVYPVNTSPNDENNELYLVDFDGEGKGTIKFEKAQIQKFDLTKWGEPATLNIKLIKTPGQWDALPKAYTGMGNNAIRIGGIDSKGNVVIDLSVTDFEAGTVPRMYDSYMAYHLDNTLEKDLPKGFTGTTYTELIIVHNASEDTVGVMAAYITDPAGWVVICDSYNAGIKPLKYSALPTTKRGETNVLIEPGKVTVPRKSTAVIAKMK